MNDIETRLVLHFAQDELEKIAFLGAAARGLGSIVRGGRAARSGMLQAKNQGLGKMRQVKQDLGTQFRAGVRGKSFEAQKGIDARATKMRAAGADKATSPDAAAKEMSAPKVAPTPGAAPAATGAPPPAAPPPAEGLMQRTVGIDPAKGLAQFADGPAGSKPTMKSVGGWFNRLDFEKQRNIMLAMNGTGITAGAGFGAAMGGGGGETTVYR